MFRSPRRKTISSTPSSISTKITRGATTAHLGVIDAYASTSLGANKRHFLVKRSPNRHTETPTPTLVSEHQTLRINHTHSVEFRVHCVDHAFFKCVCVLEQEVFFVEHAKADLGCEVFFCAFFF